jgi:hypothetical protein
MLRSIFAEIQTVTSSFNHIFFSPIYKERNEMVDEISKTGLMLIVGQ